MSLIGKSVYNVHDVNQIQFGNVISEKMENTWKWVKVSWKNGRPTNNQASPNIDIESNWFRIDTVQIFNPNDMIYDLQKL
jgi:hypothetical protein